MRGGATKCPGTCEHDDADVWVVARVVKTPYHLRGGLRAEGIAPPGAVYGDLRSPHNTLAAKVLCQYKLDSSSS